MRETYVLEDLIQTLISLEEAGNKLYTALIDMQTNEVSKKLFAILATQELKHKELYEGLLKRLKVEREPDAEYRAYVDVLLKGTITFLNSDLVTLSFEDAFEKAVRLEKDTLLFLSEVQFIIPQSSHAIIAEVAQEERKHLKLLYAYWEENHQL